MKRILCTLLAAMFALSCLPVTVFAGEESVDGAFQQALKRRMSQISEQSENTPSQENQRQVLDFNTDWLFVPGDDLNAKNQDYDESAAQAVSLPHAREAYDLYKPDIEGLQTIDWYRRHFTLPKEDEGDRVFVEFNGGGQVNRVYVNGALVGEAKGTFTHFRFEITDYVSFGEYDNLIAVQVDSRYHKSELPPGSNIDFHYFGGLHGQAALTLTDPLYAESVFYFNEDVVNGCESATLNGWVEVANGYAGEQPATLRSTVKDSGGQVVSTQETTVAAPGGQTTQLKLAHTVPSPRLWSPDDPYLYTVETEVLVKGVCVDQVCTTVGLRTLQATSPSDTEGYFILNGQRIQVLGGNRHMQAPYLGNSLTPKLNAKDAETLKHDLGINFVRTSHYETDPAFLDACDRLGIMVEEEPLGWQDTPGWEQFCYSADEMVKRDRNHPSIVMWSIIPNERNRDFPSVDAGKERQQATKALDPSRLTIQEEMNQSAVIADIYGWHDYTNPNNTNPFSVPSKAKSWFVTEWNTNLGKHFIIPNDSESRKIAQVEQDGLKLSQLSGDKRIMGTLKWDLFGYMTPMSKDERGKNVNLWRCSGVYGHWRDPLHKTWIAYLMAAQAPNPADVGDILFINSEWKADSPKSVTVSTNLDAVELYYGQGTKEPELVQRLESPNELTKLENGLFRFELGQRKWTDDSYLLAKGYKTGDTKPVKTHTVFASTYESEKEGAQLTLHNTIGEIKADGADVALLLAELTDQNGQREFYGDDNLTVEILEGPGVLWYDETPTMVDGLSGFYLKSQQDRPGTTKIKAQADLGETLDDDDPAIQYGEGWTLAEQRIDAYKGTLHQAAAGATATITFTGTQLAIYAESSDKGGSAAVTVDGQEAGSLSCANAVKYGTIANQQVWKSAPLQSGEHTVTITAKGAVNLDRLKVFDGAADVSATITVTTLPDTANRVRSDPTLPDAEQPEENPGEALKLLLNDVAILDRSIYDAAGLARLDDAVEFAQSVQQLSEPTLAILTKALNRLRQAMGGLEKLAVTTIPHTRTTMEGQSGGVAYVEKTSGTWVVGGNNTYAKVTRTPEDYYSITFEGVQIGLYSQMDSAHGIAAVSIDGGPETEVDQYHAQQVVGELFWQSEELEPGTHTVKVRVTGKTSGNPANACVSFGYAMVYERIDPLQQTRTELAGSLARADVLDRTVYTSASLDALDRAMAAAETALRDADAVLEAVRQAKEALDTALENLELQQAQASLTVTCLDEDQTTLQGVQNKIYYSSKKSDDWVLEGAGNEALRNRYLKKVATGQTPAPYAELVFTGTGVELFARYSKTSGYAWVEIRNEKNEVVGQQRNISLYDPNVGQNVPGTRSIYAVSGLTAGTYTLRLYPENKPYDQTKDLTSVNFAHAVITTGESRPTPDVTALAQAVERLNAVSLEGRHQQVKAAFETQAIRLVNNSYGLLAGTWPQISLTDPIPLGATETRIARVVQDLEAVLTLPDAPLTVASVKPAADLNVPFGTALKDLPLPLQVTVVSSDEQAEKLGVVWSCEVSYDPQTPGSYAFKGELQLPQGMTNPGGLSAEVTVKVAEPEKVFYPIASEVQGGQAQLTAPAQAAAGDLVRVQISLIEDGFEFAALQGVYQQTMLLEPDPEAEPEQTEKPEASGEPEPLPSEPPVTEQPAQEPTENRLPQQPAGAPQEQEASPQEQELPKQESAPPERLVEELPTAQPTAPQAVFEPQVQALAMSLSAEPLQTQQPQSQETQLEITEVMFGAEYTFIMPAGAVKLSLLLQPKPQTPVSAVTIQGGAASIEVGQELVLKALVEPTGAAYDQIEWKLEGDAVQTAARNEELVVTGQKPGKATITALAGGVSSQPLVIQVQPVSTPTPAPINPDSGSGETPKATAAPSPTAAPTPVATARPRQPRATATPEPTSSPQTTTPPPTQQPKPTAAPTQIPAEQQPEEQPVGAQKPAGFPWTAAGLGAVVVAVAAAGGILFLRKRGGAKKNK